MSFSSDSEQSSIRLFDSHAHYFDQRFLEEYPGGAVQLLPTLFDNDVEYIMNVGTNPNTSRLALSQAQQYESMYAAVGIHPEDAHGLDGAISSQLDEIKSLFLKHPEKVKAIGEIGLDYYRDSYCRKPTDKALEKVYFDAQLSLSEELNLPVIIHDRDAHGDTMDMLLAHPRSRGVLHSFSGSIETAKELMKRGWYISFSGVVTFKNATRLAEIVKSIPNEWLLVETDCPYLAPHPYRGRLNHSGLLIETVKHIALLRNTMPEKVAQVTMENAKRLFSI